MPFGHLPVLERVSKERSILTLNSGIRIRGGTIINQPFLLDCLGSASLVRGQERGIARADDGCITGNAFEIANCST
jgi:hypothetical protein